VLQTLLKYRYRYVPDHFIGEILAKRWMETAVPVVILVITIAWLGTMLPGRLSPASISDVLRQASETGLVVLGLGLVMIVGGIDLSVGSMFALSNFCALYCMHVLQLPVVAAVPITLVFGGLLGSVNGFLIGYCRLRAFLTTLITLIIYRSAYDLLIYASATAIAGNQPDSDLWEFLGSGSILGLPTVAYVFAATAVFGHVFLTRMRKGWHITAIGGSRRSAFNSGIAVRRTVAATYLASGVLTAMGAIFFASRLSSAGGDIGVGMEITALTACVLGGISLGGGRGNATKAVVGTFIVLLITNGLTDLGYAGGYNRMFLATILLVSAAIDFRWTKNKHRVVSRAYVTPAYHELGPLQSAKIDSGTVWALNDKLKDVYIIGEGEIEGAEDVILDRNDNLYGGSRHGDIIRFFPPDYTKWEVFAHIGGAPLGMAFDRDDNLHVCVGGMGVYRITPDRKVELVTDETNRSIHSVNDDSRMRLADDLDIADDGKIYFSEATIRYEIHDWPIDALEGRGNGRIICHDPKTGKSRTLLRNLIFPNGICIANNKQSILFAETWGCSVKRYWFEGPKKGKVETIMENLPGYPDNINWASDGNYWMSLLGMRSPALDLAWKMPNFRKEMTLQVPRDEWLFPNVNIGCVLKFNDEGEVLDILWDLGAKNHPQITSMREHRGYLFLGGLNNNRIGRYKIPEGQCDPNYVQYDRRWPSEVKSTSTNNTIELPVKKRAAS
jgi:ribose transport system permease protein